MPTVDRILADDAILLSVESSSRFAAVVSTSVSGSTVNTVHVDSVVGSCMSGAFFAGPKVLSQRQFLALVSDQNANVYKLTGTFSDTVDGIIPVSVTPILLSGAWNLGFPHYFGLVATNSTVSGTIDGIPWSDTTGFTLDIAGQILIRTGVSSDISTSKLYTCRAFPGTSVSFLPFPPGVAPVFTGLGSQSIWGAPERRLFQGTALDRLAVADDGAVATLTYSSEPNVHGIVGAQFGDLDYDVGKSVPWAKHFVDDIFIADINAGAARYWVVDWDKSFQDSRVRTLGVDYFTDPVGWRKAQFAAAMDAWGYLDDDWVLFIDATEGLSCDTRSLPDDAAINPFRSYVHREIARANDAGKSQVCIPWYAFVRNDPRPDSRRFFKISDDTLLQDQPVELPQPEWNYATVATAVPYYVQPTSFTERGLVRLVKVSTLKNPSFDWTLLDRLTQPDDGVKLQIISYAYARWVNPEGVDDGMKLRSKISQVRPLADLPVVGTDAPGVAGPYTVAVDVLVDVPGATTQTQSLLTPLYSSLFRINPRDGVWYVANVVGPEPVHPPFAFSFPPPTGLALANNASIQVN